LSSLYTWEQGPNFNQTINNGDIHIAPSSGVHYSETPIFRDSVHDYCYLLVVIKLTELEVDAVAIDEVIKLV
jgi:hypothetical protein